ncbi:MAG: ABC transporter permease, partial [Planctomycetota bacterium]
TAPARRLASLLAPFIGLAVVVGFFALVGPASFLGFYNLKNVATQTVIVGLGAVGMTFVIVSGGIDLSIGSVIALSSVVSAWSMQHGLGAAAAVLAGVACGALCGGVNGLLITRLRVVPFIVTLGMLGIARGAAKALAHEQKIDADASWLASLMAKPAGWELPVLPPGVWLMFVLAAAMAFVLRRTVFGVRTFAIGSSEPTARLCGVPVDATKLAIYALCGAFAGLAGVLQFGRLTVGDPTTALGKELDIIAAVVIGGASLSGGTGSILGSVLGAFLMSFLANGCNLMGVPNYAQEILIGVIIVVAVTIDQLRSRRG